MPYRIELDRKAAEYFSQLPVKIKRQVGRKTDLLKSNPYPSGCKKLNDDLYRIRAGDYRIIYTVITEQIIVYVLKIGDRRDIYKQLSE